MTLERRLHHAARELREIPIDVPPLADVGASIHTTNRGVAFVDGDGVSVSFRFPTPVVAWGFEYSGAATGEGLGIGFSTTSSLETSFELSAERTAKEVVVAKRQERRKKKDPPKPKEPKGKPKKPKVDAKLEPLRRAMEGKTAVVVEVQRGDEILDCVAAFEACGIRPVLYGASDAYKVVDHLVGSADVERRLDTADLEGHARERLQGPGLHHRTRIRDRAELLELDLVEPHVESGAARLDRRLGFDPTGHWAQAIPGGGTSAAPAV